MKSNMPIGHSVDTAAGHLFVNIAPVFFASVNGYVRESPQVFLSTIFIALV